MLKLPRMWFAFAVLIALLGCSDSPSGPVDADLDGILDDVDDCPSQPETLNNFADADGCPDTPAELYAIVRQDVENFWRGEFTRGSLTYRPIQNFYYYSAAIGTPCGNALLNNAFYCPGNESVYYHDAFLDGLLKNTGDMAPAFVLAHEIGHHVSRLLGWIPNVNMSVKQNELQADCFAGAWTKTIETRGLLEAGDHDEVVKTLVAVGDPTWTWFLPTLHGSPLQRRTAFDVGYNQGGGSCTQADFIGLFPVGAP